MEAALLRVSELSGTEREACRPTSSVAASVLSAQAPPARGSLRMTHDLLEIGVSTRTSLPAILSSQPSLSAPALYLPVPMLRPSLDPVSTQGKCLVSSTLVSLLAVLVLEPTLSSSHDEDGIAVPGLIREQKYEKTSGQRDSCKKKANRPCAEKDGTSEVSATRRRRVAGARAHLFRLRLPPALSVSPSKLLNPNGRSDLTIGRSCERGR